MNPITTDQFGNKLTRGTLITYAEDNKLKYGAYEKTTKRGHHIRIIGDKLILKKENVVKIEELSWTNFDYLRHEKDTNDLWKIISISRMMLHL